MGVSPAAVDRPGSLGAAAARARQVHRERRRRQSPHGEGEEGLRQRRACRRSQGRDAGGGGGGQEEDQEEKLLGHRNGTRSSRAPAGAVLFAAGPVSLLPRLYSRHPAREYRTSNVALCPQKKLECRVAFSQGSSFPESLYPLPSSKATELA